MRLGEDERQRDARAFRDAVEAALRRSRRGGITAAALPPVEGVDVPGAQRPRRPRIEVELLPSDSPMFLGAVARKLEDWFAALEDADREQQTQTLRGSNGLFQLALRGSWPRSVNA